MSTSGSSFAKVAVSESKGGASKCSALVGCKPSIQITLDGFRQVAGYAVPQQETNYRDKGRTKTERFCTFNVITLELASKQDSSTCNNGYFDIFLAVFTGDV